MIFNGDIIIGYIYIHVIYVYIYNYNQRNRCPKETQHVHVRQIMELLLGHVH